MNSSLTDEQLLRYSRHILLADFGESQQQILLQARVLLIGAGGLGCAAALYLASAGVGQLHIVDDDTVELSNLQRQIAHTTADIGESKVASLAAAVTANNLQVKVITSMLRADAAKLALWLTAADIVLDCSDNFATRQLINFACSVAKKPLISAAAIGFSGQLSVYDTSLAHSPCYACIFPPEHAPEENNCATLGVFAPLVGVMGTLQASEAIKVLTNTGQPAIGKLLLFDARAAEWSSIRIAKNPACKVCTLGQDLTAE